VTIAVYPGSFDPVTNGHLDIVRRAAALFDELIVAVYDTPSKALLFNTQERVALFAEAVRDLPNVQVTPYTGLTVEFARSQGASVIVRGMRRIADFEAEFEMALMNATLAPDIEQVYLMTSLEYQFVSASLLKEVVALGGDISRFVPPHVEEALKRRLAPRTAVPEEVRP
jgi:pantetheine-phosphate adenylyltransferase